MLNNPSSEKILSNIQMEPPLAQLKVIPSCSVPACLEEKINLHLTTPSFQAVGESDKVTLSPFSPG